MKANRFQFVQTWSSFIVRGQTDEAHDHYANELQILSSSNVLWGQD